jgi:hypothetical protein
MMVDVRGALERGGLVDITTTGRRSGLPRRIEIAVHNLDGRLYISGLPGRRGWYANLLERPHLVLHLRGSDGVSVDVPATARPISDGEERRQIMAPISRLWRLDLGVMVASSPLVEVLLEGAPQFRD